MRLLATCILFERDQKELFENPRNCLISIKSLLSIDLYTVVSVRTRIRAIRGSAGTPSVKTCTCTRCNNAILNRWRDYFSDLLNPVDATPIQIHQMPNFFDPGKIDLKPKVFFTPP